MTVSEEQAILEQLENLGIAKQKIREAIASKYVDVSESTPFINYADAIKMIGSGIGGTYGKSKVAMPLPPEGNYGGGVNPKLAWKKGQVATLVSTLADVTALFSNEVTAVIDTQAKFDTWVNFNKNSATDDENQYKVVRIVPLENGPYIVKKTLKLDLMNTEKIVGMNGVKIKWNSKIAGNISVTGNVEGDQQNYFGSRFLFEGTSSTYIYNLQIILTNAEDRISKNVYFLRGIEVTADSGTPAYGDLFADAEVLSRIYIESHGYRNQTAQVTINSFNTITDDRSGRGCIIAAKGQLSDITIINKGPARGHTGISATTSGTPKLLRCFILGGFDQGIDIESQNSLIDRCYVQFAYGNATQVADRTNFGSYGIRGGKVVNSTIAHFDVKSNQESNADNQSSFGIYGTNYVKGCKIGNCSGSAVIGIGGVNYVEDSAIVQYSLNGLISGNNTIAAIKSDKRVSNCAVYEVNVLGNANDNKADIRFKIIWGLTGAIIEKNHIGQVFLDFNKIGDSDSNSVSYSNTHPAVNTPDTALGAPNAQQTANVASAAITSSNTRGMEQKTKWLSKNIYFHLFEGGSKHIDNRVDSIYAEIGSLKLKEFYIFNGASEINNNYIGSLDIAAHHKEIYTYELALAKGVGDGSIINNVFDQMKVEITGNISGNNYLLRNAKIIKNNRVSAFKLSDAGQRYMPLTWNFNSGARTVTAYKLANGSGTSSTSISYTAAARAGLSQGSVSMGANINQEEASSVQHHLLVGILVNTNNADITGNSFGLLLNDKKQNSNTTITTIGILNENKNAVIKNNYFKNIVVKAPNGIPAVGISKLLTGTDSHLAVAGLVLGSDVSKNLIENNEFNLECYGVINTTRNAETASFGSAIGIDAVTKNNTITKNVISVRGQAKQMRCIYISTAATPNDDKATLPEYDCDYNILSLENYSYSSDDNIIAQNCHRFMNNTLRTDRHNTITKVENMYLNCFNTGEVQVNGDTYYVEKEGSYVKNANNDSLWFANDEKNADGSYKITTGGIIGDDKTPETANWVRHFELEEKHRDLYINPKPANQFGNNELPINYHSNI